MYRKSVLKNGLRVVSFPMKDRESVSFGIWCGVGGRFEDKKIKGAAHFLEHILFKGSKKYSCDEIKERVEGVGGSLNAFTAEEQTCYYAKIPAQYFSKTFDVLADMVFHPTIAPEDVERERGVILEEIKMYVDLPQYFVLDALEGLMWPDHPLGLGLAGTPESVSGLSSAKLKQFHQAYYIPNNIVIAVCGNIDHQVAVDLARKKSSKFSFGQKKGALAAKRDQQSPRTAFFHRAIEQMHVALGFYGLNAFDEDRYVLSLLNVILGGNMSSRLFNEVREKRGLAYSIQSSTKSLADTGAVLIRAGVDNRKLVEAVEVICAELRKLGEKGVSQPEFTRAKEYVIGQLLLGLEETLDHMLWMGESVMVRDRIRTMEEVVDAIKKVKRDDIMRLACSIFDARYLNIAVVGPLKKDQEKGIEALLRR